MAAIGAQVQKTGTGDALARARQRAALLPDLLVEARPNSQYRQYWMSVAVARAGLVKASGNSGPIRKEKPYRASTGAAQLA